MSASRAPLAAGNPTHSLDEPVFAAVLSAATVVCAIEFSIAQSSKLGHSVATWHTP
jgi:hypothetical protein